MKLFQKITAGVVSVSVTLAMVAAPIASFAAADDGKLEVAVISDIQYQANAVDAEGLILSKSAQMLEEAITKINTANPDVVLVTGDLTNDGTQASHDYVAGRLAAMNDADTQVYVVPGEKDVAKSEVNPNAISDAAFRTTYAALGYSNADNQYDVTTLSYAAFPKDGYTLLMLDSVAPYLIGSTPASKGRGAINRDWALAQVNEAVDYGDMVIGAAHHPSISRGSVDNTLIGLVYTVAGMIGSDGNPLYDYTKPANPDPNPFTGLDLVDKSAFAAADIEALSDAGLSYIYTGHNYMLNTVTGSSTTTADDGTVTTTSTWTDYNVGSLVASSAAVTFTTYDKAAATAEAKAVTTVDRIATVGGADVRGLVMAAQQAYTPTMVDNMIDAFMPVYNKLISMLKIIAPRFIDLIDFGSGLSGDITASVAKPAVKNLAANVLNILADSTRITAVLNELKEGFLATTVAGAVTSEAALTNQLVSYVLSDVAVQLQYDHQQVASSLQMLVHGMKSEPPDITIASNAAKDFASKIGTEVGTQTTFGSKTLALLNDILDQNLSLTLGGSHTVRELLYGPVTYYLGLATVDLWAILDNIQPTMIDEEGNEVPVPAEYKPSAVAKPLVVSILMKADGSKQDLAGLRAGLTAHADDLVHCGMRLIEILRQSCNDKKPDEGGSGEGGSGEGGSGEGEHPDEPAGVTLVNGGFESDLSNWALRGTPQISISTLNHYAGQKSVAVQSSVSEDFRRYIEQQCAVSALGTLSFSAYIKTESNLSGVGAVLFLEALDAQGNVLASKNSAAISNSGGTWQKLSVTMDLPVGTASVAAKIGGLYFTGTFYVDTAALSYVA